LLRHFFLKKSAFSGVVVNILTVLLKRMFKDHSVLYEDLRKTYPVFIYEDFSIHRRGDEILLRFHFNLSDLHQFTPTIALPVRPYFDLSLIDSGLVRNIVFHIGLIELISYWKAACSPEVVIRPALLSNAQAIWWKKVFYHGLGEFYYTNGIIPDPDDFMSIRSEASESFTPETARAGNTILIPVGGGKDSCVTLHLLEGVPRRPFIMNPRRTTLDVIKVMGFDENDALFLFRKIDPLLLDLNARGFLNGHTPFSALLAFTSLFAAVISGSSSIALSNESSANEPTIPHTTINHQYSKSFGFEKDFREYYETYLCKDINYFSLLRPLNELQIAKAFSSLPACFSSFRSCNAGSQSDSWCGKCAKCLFTFIILSPFLGQKELVRIFGRNLLEDNGLTGILEQLTGFDQEKPFECVGTIGEVNAALQFLLSKSPEKGMPVLLKHYASLAPLTLSPEISLNRLLHEVNPYNFVPSGYMKQITQMVNDW
jgi:hypothetical protein